MKLADLDLSQLPEPLRQKLQGRLERLPAELQEKLLANLGRVPPQMLAELLARGSPTLDKLLDRLKKELPESARSSGRPNPSAARPNSSTKPSTFSSPSAAAGHYNKTVQRGDSLSLRAVVVAMITVGILILLYRAGLLGA
ncbi:MAG: hypothetical protein ABI024_11985 [Vicinamibacterales bacterium]